MAAQKASKARVVLRACVATKPPACTVPACDECVTTLQSSGRGCAAHMLDSARVAHRGGGGPGAALPVRWALGPHHGGIVRPLPRFQLELVECVHTWAPEFGGRIGFPPPEKIGLVLFFN